MTSKIATAKAVEAAIALQNAARDAIPDVGGQQDDPLYVAAVASYEAACTAMRAATAARDADPAYIAECQAAAQWLADLASLAGGRQRFATIDLASGFVWWVGEADSAADACARSHAETGNTPAEFVSCRGSDGVATYAVHQVPAGFDVADGQDAGAIAATQAYFRVGFFRKA